jgi:hypothetical protein
MNMLLMLLLLLLVATTPTNTNAQNQNCPMTLWLLDDLTNCTPDRAPYATAQLYADNTCRTEDSNPNMPGTYIASCNAAGNLVFTSSACITDTCASSTPGSNVCTRASSTDTPAALWARASSQGTHIVQSPSLQSQFYRCYQINNGGSLVINFAIFGDCSDPSCGPMLTPSPILALTPSPTALPTPTPTPTPTPGPTLSPVALPPPPTPLPSPQPTPRPTMLPTPLPTLRPTNLPTPLPSTLRPTLLPTLLPATSAPFASPAAPFPTPFPTPQPTPTTPATPSAPTDVSETDPPLSFTDAPTITPTSDSASELVHLDMVLTGAAGMLAGRAAIAWESVTARHIEERAMKEMNWRVSITTNIDDQQIVTGIAGFRSRHERFLQGDTDIKPLLIKFDATVDFISVPRSVSAEDLIGEAFNSVSDREMYRDNLLAADPVFTFVTAVQIRVEGAVPIEEQLVSQANSSPDNNSMVGVIVGIVIGVLLLVALFVALFIILRRRRRRHYSKDHQGTDEINVSMQQDPNLAVVTMAALPVDKLIRYRYVEEIMVNDIEDDAVSAMTSLPGLDESLSVVEDRTVSVNLGYDFVKQQKTDSSRDNESEASYDASRGKTTEAGTSVSQTLLGLDYLEEATNEEDDDVAI